MIKITLTKEKREFIEEKYWELVNQGHPSIKKSFMDGLEELKKLCPELAKLLYDEQGRFQMESFKKYILADRAQMLSYINTFKIESGENKALLNNFFKYSLITRNSSQNSIYSILEIMDVQTCPYCNRQYTSTLKRNKVRPTLDHYFPKSKYPFLALSIWNLVPCCSICNLAKSDHDTRIRPILYPYEQGAGDSTIFHIHLKDNGSFVKLIYGLEKSFNVSIETSEKFQQPLSTQIKILHLQDLYNEHKAYILKILKNSYINSEEHIDSLYKGYPQLFDSIDDVKNLVYMNDMREENLIQNPLSKLTKDILEDLDIQFYTSTEGV